MEVNSKSQRFSDDHIPQWEVTLSTRELQAIRMAISSSDAYRVLQNRGLEKAANDVATGIEKVWKIRGI